MGGEFSRFLTPINRFVWGTCAFFEDELRTYVTRCLSHKKDGVEGGGTQDQLEMKFFSRGVKYLKATLLTRTHQAPPLF